MGMLRATKVRPRGSSVICPELGRGVADGAHVGARLDTLDPCHLKIPAKRLLLPSHRG